MIDSNTTVTTAELALILGVSDRRIRQLAAGGAIKRTERGRYLLAESIQGVIEAATSRAVPDDLRKARVELLTAQKRKIDQEIEQREADARELDEQDALIHSLTIEARGYLGSIAGWLHQECEDRDVRVPNVPNSARFLAGIVDQWAVDIGAELAKQFRAAAAEARKRGELIGSWKRFRALSGRPVDEEAAEIVESAAR